MADFHDLDELIADLMVDALGDYAANQELQDCLIAALGNAIAFQADGDTALADRLCERASIQIIEAAALSATFQGTAGRP